MRDVSDDQPLSSKSISPGAAAGRSWDVIVIGTGMGGGVAGRRLAEHGLSVLFVEKGALGRREAQNFMSDIEGRAERATQGLWPTEIVCRVSGWAPAQFFGPLGSGVGGTSVFYAAALEAPERHDLETTEDMEHPTGGWPIRYDDFLPYLRQAQDILSVRGGPNPLSDQRGPKLAAPELNRSEALLFEDLRQKGLHPYRSHEGLVRLPGCEVCLGRKCPKKCKMDGRSAGVEPALETGNAYLLANCAVEELFEASGRITGLRVRSGGLTFELTADTVVLAAGALHSPRLLTASTGRNSAGCANSSGWVGHGLMFHLNEMVAFWPKLRNPAAGATRAVSFRDFYTYEGKRLGLVQAMGVAADAGVIASFLKEYISRTRFSRIKGIGKFATLGALVGERFFGKASVFVGLLEDLALFENRVTTHPDDPDVPVIEYRVSNELKMRRSMLRRLLRTKLGWHRTVLLNFAPSLNYGHPSGTLRFGNDPATSVLDANCKAHDLDNLYVTDASFMPSSMGVNPSLTIAANALRVADLIAKRAGTTHHRAKGSASSLQGAVEGTSRSAARSPS
jgi:choline dehydrogenase-like flavoprotein